LLDFLPPYDILIIPYEKVNCLTGLPCQRQKAEALNKKNFIFSPNSPEHFVLYCVAKYQHDPYTLKQTGF